MPNLKASKKDLRKTKKRTARNTDIMSKVRNIMKKAKSSSAADAGKMLNEAYSVIDKAFKAGVIKKNAAARYKSRVMAAVNKKK